MPTSSDLDLLDAQSILDGYDGWELIEYNHVDSEQDKLFIYHHKEHGDVRVVRPRWWRRL